MTLTTNHPYIQTLQKQDPNLRQLFETVGEVTVSFFDDGFEFLLFTIIGQQVSAKVAQTLFTRFAQSFQPIEATHIASLDIESIRNVGISYRKAQTIIDLSVFIESNRFTHEHFRDKEHVKRFLEVKGIGPWTLDMYHMFVLKDLNYFSMKDLGLVSAIKKIYPQSIHTLQDIEHIITKWHPYKSIVAHYLWTYWDNPKKER